MAPEQPDMAPVVDTEEVDGEEFPWGRIRWLCNGEMASGAEMTFGLIFINPGEANPLHAHPNCEEIVFVLGGRCDHRLGEESFPLAAGQMVRIPRGVPHCARNTGWEPLRMVIAYSSPDRQTIWFEE